LARDDPGAQSFGFATGRKRPHRAGVFAGVAVKAVELGLRSMEPVHMPTMRRMKANFMPMPHKSARTLLALALWASCAAAQALQSDKAQPIHVEADAMRYNDVKQTSVFTGNVVVTKGSLVIHAAKVDVRQDPDGYDEATAYGSPDKLATFDQALDAQPGQPVPTLHGSATQIRYDGRTDVLTFTGKATLDRLSDGRLTDRAQGDVITYNDLTDIFTVVGGKGGVAPGNPTGRVRVMLAPRTAPPVAKASGPALKVSPSMEAKP